MREIHKGHRALNLKPLDHTLSIVYISTLEDIYTAINAEAFDIVDRQIGLNKDRIYSIYCDDLGRLKPDNHLSAYGDEHCYLVGDLLIAKHNESGEMVDLTESDIDYIGKQIYRTFDNRKHEVDILFPISYPHTIY